MLELHGVSVAIAGVKVLREVSLAVPAGGRVALIGRNGAGKTTTLRALMGLVPVSGGQVVIEHGDGPACPRYHRPRHGIAMRRRSGGCSASFTVEDKHVAAGPGAALPRRRSAGGWSVSMGCCGAAGPVQRKAAGLSGGGQDGCAAGR